MPFRISCFNPTLYAHYLRRFWPLAAAVFLVVVFFPGLRILATGNAHSYNLYGGYVEAQWAVVAAIELMVPCMVIGAFIAAALVFRHLHEQRASQFYLGLPVSRTCEFATCCVAAASLIALPLLAGLGVCCLFSAMVGLSALIADIARLLLASLVCLLVFGSMAALSCVLTGRSLGALLVYAGANAALGVIILGYAESASYLMPGIEAPASILDVVIWLVPAAKLLMALAADGGFVYREAIDQDDWVVVGFSQPEVLAAYAVLGVVLLVLAGALYRRRAADRTGDTVAYAPVRTACKVLAALAVSAGLTFVVVESGLVGRWPSAVTLGVLSAICLALGWFIAEMLVRRSLRVFDKRSFAQCGIMVVLLVACVAGMRFDILGRVGYVPPADQVESATLRTAYNGAVEIDPADACAVHEAILRNRDLLAGEANASLPSENVAIDYRLANGARVYRSYNIAFSGDNVLYGSGEVGEAIQDVMSTPEYVLRIQFGTIGDGMQPEMLVGAEVYLDRSELQSVQGESAPAPSAKGDDSADASDADGNAAEGASKSSAKGDNPAGGEGKDAEGVGSESSDGEETALESAGSEPADSSDADGEEAVDGGYEADSGYTVDSWPVDDGAMMTALSRADGFALYQAVCQDIREGNLTYADYLTYSYSWIEFTWYDQDSLDAAGGPRQLGNAYDHYVTVGITPTMTHTRAQLESLGIL